MSLPETVRLLVDEGIAANSILVVDTSEEPAGGEALVASLPDGVDVLFIRNGGYGAAVNAGLDFLRSQKIDGPDYVLVSTHEARPSPGAVIELLHALEENPQAAASGPQLVTGADGDIVWSKGGSVSRRFHLPRHIDYLGGVGDSDARDVLERQWMDGAFIVYRRQHLESYRFDERFFLYMEETDLHYRFRADGLSVLFVESATVWQSSDGVPPYYFARNLRLLFQKHEPRWRRVVAIPIAIGRRFASLAVKKRDLDGARQLLRGAFAPLKVPAKTEQAGGGLVIVNPLGGTLRHYQAALEDVMLSSGASVSSLTVQEPSAGGGSGLRWVGNYLLALRRAKKIAANSSTQLKVVSLWPVLGYLDLVLLRVIGGKRSALVMHDPAPLVKAVGYDRVSRFVARLFGRDMGLIVHSDEALSIVSAQARAMRVHLLPHPVFAQASSPDKLIAEPVVTVLGQYKKDRDTGALERIADHFPSAVLKIVGRGWPPIRGWDVDARFVSESEVDALLRASDAVVVPYRRFFQSGVAFRALEQGIPVVGPRNSSLAAIFGKESNLLAGRDNSWEAALAYAISSGQPEAAGAGAKWRASCLEEWALAPTLL